MDTSLTIYGISTPKKNREGGFTLIEATIALVILFIVVMGVFSAVTYATKFNRGNSQRSQALAVLQREIELLRSAKFTPSIMSYTTIHQHTEPVCPVADDGSRDITGGDKEIEYRCGIDGTLYQVETRIDDDPYTSGQQNYPWPAPSPLPSPPPGVALMKEIAITVTPVNVDGTWVTANQVRMVFRRVRAN